MRWQSEVLFIGNLLRESTLMECKYVVVMVEQAIFFPAKASVVFPKLYPCNLKYLIPHGHRIKMTKTTVVFGKTEKLGLTILCLFVHGLPSKLPSIQLKWVNNGTGIQRSIFHTSGMVQH